MKYIILMTVIIPLLIIPVFGLEYLPPEAPETAQELLPEGSNSFTQDLLYVIEAALNKTLPEIMEAGKVCFSIIAVAVAISIFYSFSGGNKKIIVLAGVVSVGTLMLGATRSLIHYGVETAQELSEYGKLLFPVMAGALSAQGYSGASSALYIGTVVLDSVLAAMISNMLVPGIYIFICISIANNAIGDSMLKNMQDFVKWLITWALKIVLYIFTGYMGITGVVSGSADMASIKAAKLTISGAVPVVGNILSDASEAIIVSAGVMKSAVGIYGMLAVAAIFLKPFLLIGAQYLMTKITAAICGVFGIKELTGVVKDFSSAMGLLLAMIGAVCVFMLISVVCFMKVMN